MKETSQHIHSRNTLILATRPAHTEQVNPTLLRMGVPAEQKLTTTTNPHNVFRGVCLHYRVAITPVWSVHQAPTALTVAQLADRSATS